VNHVSLIILSTLLDYYMLLKNNNNVVLKISLTIVNLRRRMPVIIIHRVRVINF